MLFFDDSASRTDSVLDLTKVWFPLTLGSMVHPFPFFT
jgi:hypothetical protein